jgi:hypothetical protein
LHELNVDLLNFKADGAYIYHCASINKAKYDILNSEVDKKVYPLED